MRWIAWILLLAPVAEATTVQPKETAVTQPFFSLTRETYVVLREGEQTVYGVELKVALADKRATVNVGESSQGVPPQGASIKLPQRDRGVRSLRVQRVLLPPQWCVAPADGFVACWIVYPDIVSRLTFGKVAVSCFDVDGDGRYWVAGDDGVVYADSRYVLPLEESFVAGGGRVSWSRTEQGAVAITEREPVTGINGDKDEVNAALFWNEYRTEAGLPPAWLDPELSRDCLRACEYLQANGPGENIHTLIQGKPRYTDAGAAAAKAACIGQYPGALVHVEFFLSELYHKRPLLLPETARIGIASRFGYVLADGMRGQQGGEPAYWKRPLMLPAHGQTTSVVRYTGNELPSPLPGMGKPSGASILLMFQNFNQVTESAAADFYVKRGRGWARLPIWFSAPNAPANSARPGNDGCIAIFPKENLGVGKTYRVVVRYKLPNADPQHYEWIFHTRK